MNDFAKAVLFAVDSGATVTGGLTPRGRGFKFAGQVAGGGYLRLRLRTRDGVVYKLVAMAKGFTAAGSTLPFAATTFRVGNDCFAVSLPCIAAGGCRYEVCKPPRR